MRYELVVLDADVMDLPVDTADEATLRELTDLGATLGIVSDLPEPALRMALGRAQHHFDALECSPRAVTAVKLMRIVERLEFSRDRTLLVSGDLHAIQTARSLGVASAGASWRADQAATILAAPSHVIARLPDIIDILAGRPTLRIVR